MCGDMSVIGVGRAELWGVSQLKISPGGGFERGCKFCYIFFEVDGGGGGGGSGQPGNPAGYILVCDMCSDISDLCPAFMVIPENKKCLSGIL